MSTNFRTRAGTHVGKRWGSGPGRVGFIWQLGPTGLGETVEEVAAALRAERWLEDERGRVWHVCAFLQMVAAAEPVDAEREVFC